MTDFDANSWLQVLRDHASKKEQSEHFDGIDPQFGRQIAAAILAAEAATGDKVFIADLYRSNAEQAQLYANSKGTSITVDGKTYSPNDGGEGLGRRVAHPKDAGHQGSNHLAGNAVDILPSGKSGEQALKWLATNGAQFGITQPFPKDDRGHIQFSTPVDPKRLTEVVTAYVSGKPPVPALTAIEDVTSPKGSYTVKAGETLTAIAKANGTTVARLAEINGISDPNKIKPGQSLTLPGAAPAKPTSPAALNADMKGRGQPKPIAPTAPVPATMSKQVAATRTVLTGGTKVADAAAAKTVTINGNIYVVGTVFPGKGPGDFNHIVTEHGIERSTRVPTGEPNIMSSVVGGAITQAIDTQVAPAIEKGKVAVAKMGSDIAATGSNLLSGAGTILGGIFGGGSKPAADARTVLTANMAGRGRPPLARQPPSLVALNADLAGRGQPQPVAPIPALQSPATALKRGAVLTVSPSQRVAALSPGGTVLSPLTSPTILGQDAPATLGPAMPRGALAVRRAAAAKAQQDYVAAEAKRAGAVVAAQAAAAAARVKAAADAAQRLVTARAAQQAAKTAAQTAAAAISPAPVGNVGSPGAYISPTFAEMTNRTVEEIQTYRQNRADNGGRVFGT